MSRPSKGARKQIAGRLPLEVFEAFERRRGELGLAQNEALILALKLWAGGAGGGLAAVPTPDPASPRPATAARTPTKLRLGSDGVQIGYRQIAPGALLKGAARR